MKQGLLFVDTSAWFAFVNRRDPSHRAVRQLFDERAGKLVTSNFILDETVTLCLYRLGHDVAVQVGKALRSGQAVDLIRVSPDDEAGAWTLFRKRDDKQYSFTDCTTFTMMRRLGIRQAIALGDEFRQEGLEVLPGP